MIRRVIDLARELRDVSQAHADLRTNPFLGMRLNPCVRWHPRPQQETERGVVLAFLGVPCEFGRDCAYPGLGWRCGHRRQGR